MLLPLASAAAWIWVWRASRRGSSAPDWAPFAGSVLIFILAFAGLAYSLFPFLVIDRLTFRDAAAHPSALWSIFYGTAAVLPFLTGYTVFAYRVFGGKARELTYV